MPNFPIQGISCALKCRQDNDCKKNGEICCFNGCGVECMPSGGKSQLPSTAHSVDHSGKLAFLEEKKEIYRHFL